MCCLQSMLLRSIQNVFPSYPTHSISQNFYSYKSFTGRVFGMNQLTCFDAMSLLHADLLRYKTAETLVYTFTQDKNELARLNNDFLVGLYNLCYLCDVLKYISIGQGGMVGEKNATKLRDAYKICQQY